MKNLLLAVIVASLVVSSPAATISVDGTATWISLISAISPSTGSSATNYMSQAAYKTGKTTRHTFFGVIR